MLLRLSAVALILVFSVAWQEAFAQGLPSNSHWVEHIGFNVLSAPLDNVAVRQAIASAIDRRALVEQAKSKFPAQFAELIGPATSWFPPFLPQHGPNIQVHPFDLAAAKALLEKAGFPAGAGLPELELLYRQDPPFGPPRAIAADVVKNQLTAIGIKVKVTGLPSGSAFFARVQPGPGRPRQYQMAIFAWGTSSVNDDFFSEIFLQGGPRNPYEYRNPEVTLLIVDIRRETNPDRRIAMLREAEQLVLLDAPVIPLAYWRVP